MNRGRPRHSPLSRRLMALAVGVCLSCILLALADGALYLVLKSRGWGAEAPGLPAMMRPDSTYIWDYIPNHSFFMRGEGRVIEGRTNSRGFRGAPLSRDPKYRILAVGDSFTFGWLVEEEDLWCERLEGELTRRGKGRRRGESLAGPEGGPGSLSPGDGPVECVNLGMWMSSFDQHYLRTRRKGMDLSPSLVVHLIYLPHLQTLLSRELDVENGTVVGTRDPFLQVREGRIRRGYHQDGAFVPIARPPLGVPMLPRFVGYRIAQREFRRRYEEAVGVFSDLPYQNLMLRETASAYEPGWTMLRQVLRSFRDLCAGAGVPYRTVLIPADIQVSREEWNVLGGKGDDRWVTTAYPQERFVRMARELGIPVLDLLPAFRAEYSQDLYYPVDPHWTAAGHALAARRIAEWLGGSLALAGEVRSEK